jgi:hypothetical protein
LIVCKQNFSKKKARRNRLAENFILQQELKRGNADREAEETSQTSELKKERKKEKSYLLF